MEYKVQIEFLYEGIMKESESYISSLGMLRKRIPAKAIAFLKEFSMDYQIKELRKEVKEEGYGELYFQSGGNSIEIVVSEY